MDSFKIIQKNRELYKEMLHDIRNAKKYIYLETYIFDNDKIGKTFKEELLRKTVEGLDIKILLDDYGCSIGPKYFQDLSDNGAKVLFFRKLKISFRLIKINNHRNHRKLLIIDDRIIYLGSSNISHKTINWLELNIKIKGRIATVFKKIFLQNFKIYNKKIFNKKKHTEIIKYKCLEIIRDVPSIRIRNFRRKKIELIKKAQKEIIIETPYFIPEALLVRKIKKALKKGVKVTLLVPKKSDVKIVDIVSKKYLFLLHKLGVNIMLYKQNVLHSKLIIADDKYFLFGSTNIDPRSLSLQFEINLYGENKEIVYHLKDHIKNALCYSENYNPLEWAKRPRVHKLLEFILNKIIKFL